MLLALVILANVGVALWDISLVRLILKNREARLLRKLRRNRSSHLARLYRRAVGTKAGEVIAFPAQHYINQTLVA